MDGHIMFQIPGEPKAKARPRKGKNGFYTPEGTVNYETWVKQCYIIEHKNKKLEGPIEAEIIAFMKIPKNVSKKKRKEMIAGIIRPTKKPDTDNIAKIVLDSLNDLAYSDDKYVVDLNVKKYYSENPRVEVVLSEVRN